MPKTDDGGWILDDSVLEKLVFSPVCSYCKHMIAGPVPYGASAHCAAFDAIPDSIWRGENDHREPYPGDRGIRFESR